jgi:hypothetical protein
MEAPGGAGIRVPITLNDLLEMELGDNAEVNFTVNWKNVGFDEARVPKKTRDAVDSMVAEAELRYGNRMSQAIRLIAHMQGSTNYKAVASSYSDELKAPLLEALMLPQG